MLRLARTIARLLELSPGREFATSFSSPALDAAVGSLVNASGAVVVSEEIAPSGVVELEKAPSPLVPEQARTLISRVVAGGTVVVVIHRGPKFDENAQSAARRLGPMFDLEHVHGELVDAEGEAPAAVVLRGKRRTQPSRDRIKELRGIAHNLDATILIGRDGLSEGLVASAREALERHGLVKAKLTPRARLDKDDSAVDLAWAAGGQLIQRVGKTAVIFRPDVPLSPPVMRR
jgi:RNA-binding protein